MVWLVRRLEFPKTVGWILVCDQTLIDKESITGSFVLKITVKNCSKCALCCGYLFQGSLFTDQDNRKGVIANTVK